MCARLGRVVAALGVAGLVPGTFAAAALVVACAGIFGLGETLLQPTIPAITNDLAPDHLRGRYNADHGRAFQVRPIVGPAVAGVLIGAAGTPASSAMLLVGCAAMAWIALRTERRIPPHVNGELAVRAPSRPCRGRALTPSPGQEAEIPQRPSNSWPGASTMRSCPLRNASGGQVIGSTATPLVRRSGSGSASPVKTCSHG